MISSDIRRHAVADLLVRDVPDDVLAAIDEKARRLGLSRAEYLRRALTRERTMGDAVTGTDLRRFAAAFADLGDPEIMRRAWE
jgi:Ribbon-helix-helix protein, copG family